jgi:mono/diheme cytochrome c family protein
MKIVKVIGVVLVALILLAGAGYGWASSGATKKLARAFDTHEVDIPVPYPLTDEEIADLRAAQDGPDDPDADPLAGIDLEALAAQRALARGRHLVDARFICTECHGQDFGGGVMVDDPAIGRLLGPNLTLGEGSRTRGYTMTDWDRIVRHGLRRDGTPSLMPSEDFVRMSDRELSDIVFYIRSFPPVDREVPPVTLGPVGRILMATDQWPLSADMLDDHQAGHAALPPPEGVTVAFGAHVGQVCTGCHGHDLGGQRIPAGPPSWPESSNLTPHADGLAGWTFEDFDRAMREGRLPGGGEVREPMTLILPYSRNLTDTEMRALWLYLQSVPPKAKAGGA